MAELDINNEPTVFVLGAGASQPYGFPLGIGLKSDVLGNESGILRQCLTENGYDDAKKKWFKNALRDGDHDTIDLFLERKPSLKEMGAYYIADVIARRERKEALRHATDNWYKILYNMLSLDSNTDTLPPIGIVTLNYDRSLEHFLSYYLDCKCRESLIEHGKSKLAKLKVIHAHGHIGRYDLVPYGDAATKPEWLHKAAKRIRIVPDSMEESIIFQEAVDLIGNARNVVFIGFGYNRITLERLLKKTQPDQVRLFGTGYQLGKDTQSQLEQMFYGKMKLGDVHVQTVGFLKQLGLNGKNSGVYP
jgi:hypothetical protein